ncbi:MAG: virulence-associated E family protein [Solibacillus sp.]
MQDQAKTEQQDIRLKHDAKITIATATSRKSTSWKNKEMLYSDFVKKVATTVRTKETLSEYMKLPKAEQDEIKDVGGFVAGSLKNGRRKADNVAWRQLITLDADFIEGDFWDGVTAIFDNACLIYSTHKHQNKKPRLRLIIPLSKPVTAEEYVAVSKKLAEQFGIDYFDDTTYQPHRLMYWPSTASDAEYVFEYQDAPFVDPVDILALYNDWRDPREWPESSRQRESRKKMADKQGDPLEKAGMVGAFCRTFSITEAIETFLSDKYEHAGDGRFSYLGGTTTGGLVVYDDLFAYSHHGTDPTSEQLVNAFDLVRLHLFDDLDEEAKPGTPINRMPSVKAMSEFAKKDERVKLTLAAERLKSVEEDFLDEPDATVDAVEKADTEWMKQLVLMESGEYEVSAKNIKLILENDPNLTGCFGFNEFNRQPEILRNLPWRKRDKSVLWTNGDDQDLRTYLDLVWGIKRGREKIDDVLGNVQRSNAFHPVRDYLESLSWDGDERVATLLTNYLNATDSEYTRTVTKMTMVAAVARIFEPGCKYDYMLTLVGPQGLGKSMLFNRLGGAWYSDSLTSVNGKEAYEALHGVWLMEMGELAATRKAETEAIKHFLTKQVDRYRVAYGKRPEEFPRQCIFIGTTNEDEFLRDKTGNRRFLPVQVAHGAKQSWSDISQKDVDQIWAEAVHLYHSGFALYLDERMAAEALEMQLAHTEESVYTGQIIEFMKRPITTDWYTKTIAERKLMVKSLDDFEEELDDTNELIDEILSVEMDKYTTIYRDKICPLEIWCECLGKDKASITPYDRREIMSVLNSLPGWKKHNSTIKFGGEYGTQRGFIRTEIQ